jgi:hypothetical protein
MKANGTGHGRSLDRGNTLTGEESTFKKHDGSVASFARQVKFSDSLGLTANIEFASVAKKFCASSWLL